MGAPPRNERPTVAGVPGFVIVAAAGVLIVISSVLPWIRVNPVAVEEAATNSYRRSHSPHEFSGWDIANTCGQANGLIKCSIGVSTARIEGRQSIVTGPVTAGVGAALIALGIMGALSLRWGARTVMNCARVGSWFAAGAAAGLATLFWWSSGEFEFQIGVQTFWVATLLAAAGALITAAAIGRPRAARTSARVLGAFGVMAFGWIGAALLSTA
jgi:hypothetical protein